MDTEKPTENNNKAPISDANAPNPFGGQSRISSLASTLMEWFATIAMVLAFFIFLIWGATYILPEGTGLISLDEENKEAENIGGDAQSSQQGNVLNLGSSGSVAAILSETHRTVKHKAAESISWLSALQGMELFDQDAVKTASASHAVIEFDESNRLKLGPDSLVIVKHLEEDSRLRKRRSALVMIEGELRGSVIASSAKQATNVEVIIPGGIARINAAKGSKEKIDYEIKINPDESTSVLVIRGNAEVEAQNKKVELGANQITYVVKGGAPSKPMVLPDNVKITKPANNALAYYRDFPQEIRFDWEATKEQRYRLVIARDISFKDVVFDEIVTEDEFIHGDLHQGFYSWRVASVTADGNEGEFSKFHRLEVVQDIEPPYLTVNFHTDSIVGGRISLNGHVEPGATLIVDGEQVSPDGSGRFKAEVRLKIGMNVVVAQAVDAAGNSTFVSKRVSRDF